MVRRLRGTRIKPFKQWTEAEIKEAIRRLAQRMHEQQPRLDPQGGTVALLDEDDERGTVVIRDARGNIVATMSRENYDELTARLESK
jgi:hypothetical protein